VAELASCLWYLKTKHFKVKWDDTESSDDDPRVRRALGRLNKAIERLRQDGIEVQDPTNTRYPQGGEGMMRPIQFLPTDGLTVEVVSETVAPIIYRDDRLIQRGEVFVAVPKREEAADPASTAMAPSSEATAADESTASGAANAAGESAVDEKSSASGVAESPQPAAEPDAAPAAESGKGPKRRTRSRKRTHKKN
jgi:hypothetical protein